MSEISVISLDDVSRRRVAQFRKDALVLFDKVDKQTELNDDWLLNSENSSRALCYFLYVLINQLLQLGSLTFDQAQELSEFSRAKKAEEIVLHGVFVEAWQILSLATQNNQDAMNQLIEKMGE